MMRASRLLPPLATLLVLAAAHAEVRLIRFSEAKQFRMGAVVSNRFVHPEMGARKLTLNFSVSEPGNEFAQHTHGDSDDTIVILQGAGDLRQGDTRHRFTEGQSAFIPGGQIHGTITAGKGTAIMISFQTPPDMALYSGARDSTRAGAKPVEGKITPGAVKFVEFAGRNGPFVRAERILVSHWMLKPGEKLYSSAPPDGEHVLFVWKGSVAVGDQGGRVQAGERDAVFVRGPMEFEFQNLSDRQAVVIQAQAPPPK